MRELASNEKVRLNKEKLKKFDYVKIKAQDNWVVNGNYLIVGKIYKIKRRSNAHFFINPDIMLYGKWHELGYHGYNKLFHFVTDEYAQKHGYRE